MPDYGTDVSCWPDLDPMFGSITGVRLLAESAIRRVTTIRGTLKRNPNYGMAPGTDIFALLNAELDQRRLPGLAAQYAAQIEQDERVKSASVDLTLVNGLATISIGIQPSDGDDFKFRFTVDKLGQKRSLIWGA